MGFCASLIFLWEIKKRTGSQGELLVGMGFCASFDFLTGE